MSNFRTLGTTILILAACCGSVAAQSGTINFTLSSACNGDLLGTDGLIAAANAWHALHPSSDYTIFDVFGDHFGMNSYSDRTCYYVNAPGATKITAVPYSGIITTPYAAYQLGPVSLATSATTPATYPSVAVSNVIVFGKSYDGIKTMTVNLPQSQQMCYSSVNFLVVYWHQRYQSPVTSVSQAMILSAVYDSSPSPVVVPIFTGTIPGWNATAVDPTFRPALTCSYCVGYNTQGKPKFSTLWSYSGGNGGPWQIFEFSPSLATYSTSTLIGFQFAAVENRQNAESLAAILAGAGCPAPDPPSDAPQFTVSLTPSWVYQNTAATLASGGHFSNLTVTITNSNGNSSFTSSVAAAGSGSGQVTVMSTSNALAWVIQGGARQSDGVSGSGSVTLLVTVQGNSGGQSTQQIEMKVRPLGDITDSGAVGSNDLFQMNQRLNGLPVSYAEATFNLSGNGAVATGDRVLLNRVLNNLPVP